MEGSDSHRHVGDPSADHTVFRLKAIECLEVAMEHKEIFLSASIGNRGDLLSSHLMLNEMGLQELLCCWTCVYCDSNTVNWNSNDDRKSVQDFGTLVLGECNGVDLPKFSKKILLRYWRKECYG